MLVNLSIWLAVFGLFQSNECAKQAKYSKSSNNVVIPSKMKVPEVNNVRVRSVSVEKADLKRGSVIFQSKSSESGISKPGENILVSESSKVAQTPSTVSGKY
jgi:hypothetical protein